jgi:hypothetical protein
MDRIEDLIVGPQAGRILGLAALVELADSEKRGVHTC